MMMMMMTMMSVHAGDVEADFNKGFILPPLIVQLRKILDQYPDDTQILRVSNEFLHQQ